MSTAAAATSDYVGIREASRLAGKSTTWVLSEVVRGSIRTKVLPGRAPVYSVEDIERSAKGDYAR